MCSQTVDRATTDPARARQELQDGELARRELDGNAGPPDLPGRGVDRQLAQLEGRYRISVGAANHRVDPGDELREREWLGEVVVGAEIETANAIVDHVARRQDEHRRADSVGASRLQAPSSRRGAAASDRE